MARPLFSVAALVAAVAFAAACSDDSPTLSPSDGPSFVVTSPNACTFNGNPSLNKAIGDYFTVTADKSTRDHPRHGHSDGVQYRTGAQLHRGSRARLRPLEARRPGGARRSGSSTTNGAAVIRQTLQCMYNVPAATGAGQAFEGWPTAEQFNFKSALEFADGGAFFVRGDATKDDETAPVVAQVSGPDLKRRRPATSRSWQREWWCHLVDDPGRAGADLRQPLPDDAGCRDPRANWKFIPRSATFDPNGVVALCSGLGIDFGDSGMIIQAGVGVLNFIDASTLCDSPVVALQGRSLLQRMSRFAVRALSPEPAYAARRCARRPEAGWAEPRATCSRRRRSPTSPSNGSRSLRP